MDIQDILDIYHCSLLPSLGWQAPFPYPYPPKKEIQTDVAADVADATGVLHTKNRTTFF